MEYYCPNCGYRGPTQSHYCSPGSSALENGCIATALVIGFIALVAFGIFQLMRHFFPTLNGLTYGGIVLVTIVLAALFWWGMVVAKGLQERWTALARTPRPVIALGFLIMMWIVFAIADEVIVTLLHHH